MTEPALREVQSPDPRHLRWSAIALVAVGVLFFALVNAVITIHNPYSTDEVDYLAQVTPANPHLVWSAVRAWGVPVLFAPAAVFSPSEGVIRLYASVVLAVGMVGAFWTWRRVLHPVVAPLACLMFATVFTTTLYGNGVMPNLPVALLAVAVTGLLARLPQARRRGLTLTGIGVAFAAVALFRPTDSLLVSVPVLVCILLVRERRRIDTVVAVLVGEILGWLPWFIESFITFGGPVARWKAGSQTGINGLHLSVQMFNVYPRLFGKMAVYCCYGAPASKAGPSSSIVVAWFVAIPILALLGLLAAAKLDRLAAVAPVALSAAAFTLFYFVLLDYGSPRFILPILALLSIPVALGLVWVVAAVPAQWRWLAVAGSMLVLAAHLGLQGEFDVSKRGGVLAERQRALDRATAVQAVVPRGRPCLIVGGGPQVTAYYLRCHIFVTHKPFIRMPPAVQRATQRGWNVAVVKPGPGVRRGSFLASWRRRRVHLRTGPPVNVFSPVGQGAASGPS